MTPTSCYFLTKAGSVSASVSVSVPVCLMPAPHLVNPIIHLLDRCVASVINNRPYRTKFGGSSYWIFHVGNFCVQLDKFCEYNCREVMSSSCRQLLLYVFPEADDPRSHVVFASISSLHFCGPSMSWSAHISRA